MSRFAILAASLALAGCYRSLDAADVPGRYSWKYEGGEHALRLGNNGRYVHSWRDAAGSHTQEGRWTIASRNRFKSGQDLCLYVELDDYADPTAMRAGGSSVIENLCGLVDMEGPFLIIDDDQLWAYRKNG